MRTLRLSILVFSLCGLAIPAVGQQDSDWTWKDGKGVERTRAELDKILAEYEKYITSNFREGKLANLISAKLRGADLVGVKLQGVNLLGADLQRANLRSAKLQGALLSDANLQRTNLRSADLQGALLVAADLQGAYLSDAKLQGVNLLGADLQGAVMKNVRGLPDITGLAFVKGLSAISFGPEDIPIFVSWKKALQEAGYTRTSKDLVAAIR